LIAEKTGMAETLEELEESVPNRPIRIGDQLYVFPRYMDGGQCTARTARGPRCRNPTWDEGQVAPCESAFVRDRVVTYYGPLHGHVAERHLAQRCRLHHTPEAVAYCDPEWEPFDLEQHVQMTEAPQIEDLLDYAVRKTNPPLQVWSAVLRGALTDNQRQELITLLAE
jgi:hypothetical protein